MNRLPEDGHGPPAKFAKPIPLPEGFLPTWAGPFGRTFCFGSEDGKLFFTNEHGKIVSGVTNASMSREAINGVALSDIWLAASTREDVTFLQLMADEKGERPGFAFPHGAHGIISTPRSGYFLAPLGRTGIMAVAPPITLDGPITVHGADQDGLYNYRVGCLVTPKKTEVLISAARLGGLAFSEFSGSAKSHIMNTVSLEGLDVVDFCPLFPGTDSLAVAVLGRDRQLLLFKDLLTDKKPATFNFKTVQGTAYRVLSCGGDVYVVTSNGIYMLAKLSAQFMSSSIGENINTQILVMPIAAVDANLCGDEWMLVVTSDGVQRFDVRALHETEREAAQVSKQNGIEESHPAVVSEGLRFDDVKQNSREYALAS